MKKRTKLFASLIFFCSMGILSGCATESKSEVLNGVYSVHVSGYDWGSGTSKAILSLDAPLDAVSKEDFSVTETKMATNFTMAPEFPVEEVTASREVISAYLSDEKGEAVDGTSNYVTLELYTSPNEGSPFLFTMATQLNTWSKPYYLTISLSDQAKLSSKGNLVESINIEPEMTNKTTDADVFMKDTFKSSDGVNYNYAYYEPKNESETLVVWLHGLGEGGTEETDPDVTLLGNKVTSLASEEFQGTIGGAHVLVPQSPTYWMDSDGTKSNFNNGKIIAGTSYYTASLNELIENYKEKVGAKKVVLAGCSNGGYMTMVLAMAYPEQYTAIVPICEALPDQLITEEQIESIKNIPMFFIYSEDDEVVDPTLHSALTIQRLQEAGAENIQVSTTDHVIDTSGAYKDAEGNPYQYPGHWSWIYFHNNESQDNQTGQHVWEWLAKQVE